MSNVYQELNQAERVLEDAQKNLSKAKQALISAERTSKEARGSKVKKAERAVLNAQAKVSTAHGNYLAAEENLKQLAKEAQRQERERHQPLLTLRNVMQFA